MQLDIYVPSLGLAFEFHGEQHYRDVHMFGPQHQFRGKDEEKIEACAAKGITLFIIPYWWDLKRESLAATIYQRKPELLNILNSFNQAAADAPGSVILEKSALEKAFSSGTNTGN